MYKHPGYEVQFTLKVPANCQIDLGDRWFDLMTYIIDHNKESDDAVTFSKRSRGNDEDKWKVDETDAAFALQCNGYYVEIKEDGSLVVEKMPPPLIICGGGIKFSLPSQD